MADKQRNITKSVQPKPVPLVIRWLGCYGSFEWSSVDFEAQATRVSCEVLGDNTTKLNTGLGLLVDTDKTKLIRAWNGDAYTPRSGKFKVLSYKDNSNRLRFVSRWDRVHGLSNKHNGYLEALVSNPTYSAVLTSRGYEVEAQHLARRLGIPVISLDELAAYIRTPDNSYKTASYPKSRCKECKVAGSNYLVSCECFIMYEQLHRKWCSLYKEQAVLCRNCGKGKILSKPGKREKNEIASAPH